MAPPKHVAEVPRSILPRLTWNSSSSRPTLTSSHHSALATRQPHRRQGWSPLARQLHSLSANHPASQSLSSSHSPRDTSTIVARQTLTSSSATRPSSKPFGNPVRHNGVYVATFNPARRAFHATPARHREHHFDTLKFVQRLQDEGFSEEQAVAMMRVLNDIIQESVQNLSRTMVLREGEHLRRSIFAIPS